MFKKFLMIGKLSKSFIKLMSRDQFYTERGINDKIVQL